MGTGHRRLCSRVSPTDTLSIPTVQAVGADPVSLRRCNDPGSMACVGERPQTSGLLGMREGIRMGCELSRGCAQCESMRNPRSRFGNALAGALVQGATYALRTKHKSL